MSIEKPSDPRPLNDAALDDWQNLISNVAATPAEESIQEDTTTEYEDRPELACGLCYRPFGAEELTVASKERFNWEASVVVCPECLTELKLEMRAKSSGPDLLLGLVWAVVGFVVITALISVAVYSVRADPNYGFWVWLGCYFAFVPGFIIGRMVRYGVGKRHSLEQQLIAMFFTLLAALVTAYAGWVAYNNNLYEVLNRTPNSGTVTIPNFSQFVSQQLLPGLFDFTNLGDLPIHLGVDIGIIVGLIVAYFSSEGARIYTRPFVRANQN